ncbi:hypothetical protein PMIN03_009057 [Paraphaeosphaeria minitans]
MPNSDTRRLHAPTANLTTVGPASIFDGFSGTNMNSAMLEPGYWRESLVNAFWTRDSSMRMAIDRASNIKDESPMAMVWGVSFEPRWGMVWISLMRVWTTMQPCLWVERCEHGDEDETEVDGGLEGSEHGTDTSATPQPCG